MIQSVNNKKIKEYAKLIQKKERDKTGIVFEESTLTNEAFNWVKELNKLNNLLRLYQ